MLQPRPRLVAAGLLAVAFLAGAVAVPAGPGAVDTAEQTADRRVPGVDARPHADGPVHLGPLGGSVADGLRVPGLDPLDGGLPRVELGPGGLDDGPLGPSGLVALAAFGAADEADPLDDPLRDRLFAAVRRSPGRYPAALAEAVDAPRSTVRYHLRVLEDAEYVSVRSVDGKRRYVAADASAAERALAVVDEGSTAAGVVDSLARDGEATVSDLAARLDRSAATVSYHLDRLDEAGVVERERDGQAVLNRLTPEVRTLVASVAAPASRSVGVASDD